MLRLLLFLGINFLALGIGGILIGNPATNAWYQSVNKAPWTPPGWVFGAAWTSIMVCFSVFLWRFSKDIPEQQRMLFYLLFGLQFILNVGWNPVFFRGQFVLAGLIIIILLTVLVGIFLVWGFRQSGTWGLLVLPYFVWLCIASSLNAYVLLKN